MVTNKYVVTMVTDRCVVTLVTRKYVLLFFVVTNKYAVRFVGNQGNGQVSVTMVTSKYLSLVTMITSSVPVIVTSRLTLLSSVTKHPLCGPQSPLCTHRSTHHNNARRRRGSGHGSSGGMGNVMVTMVTGGMVTIFGYPFCVFTSHHCRANLDCI